MNKPLITYPEVFAAIGRFINRKKLRDVCVMEFEGGLIVSGSVFFDKGEGFGRTIETQVFSFDELRQLVKEH
jgi:hypothetical protein